MVKRTTIRRPGVQAVLVWHGDEVLKDIEITMQARLVTASNRLRNRVIQNISVPVGRTSRTRGAGGRFVKGRVTERSKPGEFPRRDTGRLRKSIFAEVEGLSARVGTDVFYGLFLETTLDRSFLERTFREMAPELRGILTQGRFAKTRFKLDRE